MLVWLGFSSSEPLISALLLPMRNEPAGTKTKRMPLLGSVQVLPICPFRGGLRDRIPKGSVRIGVGARSCLVVAKFVIIAVGDGIAVMVGDGVALDCSVKVAVDVAVAVKVDNGVVVWVGSAVAVAVEVACGIDVAVGDGVSEAVIVAVMSFCGVNPSSIAGIGGDVCVSGGVTASRSTVSAFGVSRFGDLSTAKTT